MHRQIPAYLIVILVILPGGIGTAQDTASPATGRYPIRPVDIKDVQLTDSFWLPLVRRVQEKTIAYALAKCAEEGRMDNFLIAGGVMHDTIRGAMPFDDTDLYKIIEGAAYSLISSPDPHLDALLDSLIQIIAVGQEDDGYLTTWRTAGPAHPPAPWVKVIEGKRWESLEASHELYNAGHLYEAAAAHYRATGKVNFLDIAIRNADLMVETFGDGRGKIAAVPGHQIIETGLLQLYKITGRGAYLDLAKYFLDSRGKPEHHKLFGPYSQDHLPVTEQKEVVGHAVRAMYMYAAMTDIAVLQNATDYKDAVLALWENMVTKKMYVTGGIGARHEGEAFGENYELPNQTAYSETCAAIGSIYWNHRLHLMSGEAKYFDIIERTLYNAMIAGISLEGTEFFYPNALASDGEYKFNRGHCTRQGWFDCSCCPTNMIRFLPAMPALIYAFSEDDIYVNLIVGSEADMAFPDGKFHIQQKTEYPWRGGVDLTLKNETVDTKVVHVRLPHWLRNQAVPDDLYTYTAEQDRIPLIIHGHFDVTGEVREYVRFRVKPGQETSVKLIFENVVRKVSCHPAVEENAGKSALEYGPFVYAFEGVDNPAGLDDITVGKSEQWTPAWHADLLEGIMTLESESNIAIPYYAWSNRGAGQMKVWVDSGK